MSVVVGTQREQNLAAPAVSASRKPLKKIRDDLTYYPHQTSAIREMARMGSFLLADDMGLGKSIQALTVAAIDFELGYASRVLIVCPASCKDNWLEDEIRDHTQFTATVLNGPPAQRQKQLDAFDTDILIVGYEQAISHLTVLNEMKFDIVIVDEAHMMKGYKSARSKAVRSLAAQRFFLLTGSPMLNRPDELWAILNRIAPDEYPKYWGFVSRFCVFGGFKDKQVVGVKNSAELREKLHSVMIRRLKTEVLDLPEKLPIDVKCILTPEQRKLYTEVMEELKVSQPGNPDPMTVENGLTKFLRLKQICGTTACIPGHPDSSGKLDEAVARAVQLVESGERVVAFTQFREVQARFAARLIAQKVPVYQLHGDVPIPQRKSVINEWAAAEPGVMIGMFQVAGTGLNMTAAKIVFLLDKLYVPKFNEQAEDRCHRIGADKTQPVQIYNFICRGTAEDRIERILKSKVRLNDEIIETSAWRKKLYEAVMNEEEI